MANSPLYNDRMNNIFGRAANNNSSGQRNIEVNHLKVIAESISRMEKDALDTSHDLQDISEMQLELLTKIEKRLHKIEKNGGGGIGAGGLAAGLLGGSMLKNGFKGILGKAMKLPSIGGDIFKGATSKVADWSRRVTGSFGNALGRTASLVKSAGTRIVAGAGRAVKLMSSTILSSITKFMGNISSLMGNGLRNLSRLAGKVIGPAFAALSAYDLISGIPDTKEGLNSFIAKNKQRSADVNKALDDRITTPSEVFKSLTGARTPFEAMKSWFGAQNSSNSSGLRTGGATPKQTTATNAISELNAAAGIVAKGETSVAVNNIKVNSRALSMIATSAKASVSAEVKMVQVLQEIKKPIISIESNTKRLKQEAEKRARDSFDMADVPIGTQAYTAGMTGSSDPIRDILQRNGREVTGQSDAERAAAASSISDTVFKAKQIMPSPSITQAQALSSELGKFGAATNHTPGFSGATGEYDAIKATSEPVTRSVLSGAGANDNAKSWHSFFTKPQSEGGLGYSEEASKGMIAVMQGESGRKLDPNSVNPNDSGKESIGTANWRGDRNTALRQHAASMGLQWNDRAAQQSFFKKEMETTHKHVDAGLRGAKTAQEALEVGVKDFEVPANPGAEIIKRNEHLKQLSSTKFVSSNGLLNPSLDRDLQSSIVANGDASKIVKERQDKLAAVRRGEIDPTLKEGIAQEVLKVFGPGYRAEVYSGGQPSSGPNRTGSHRHDDGGAGDLKIFGPDGKQVTQDQYATFGQSWIAQKKGGIGLQMSGGGIHVDKHSNKAPFWNYNNEGGIPLGRSAQEIIQRGIAGQLPEYKMTDAQAAAAMRNNANIVKTQTLKEASQNSGGMARLLGRDKFAARPGAVNTNSASMFDMPKVGPNGLNLRDTGTILGQDRLLEKQGLSIAKGIVEADKSIPKRMELSPNIAPGSIMESIPSMRSDLGPTRSPTGKTDNSVKAPDVNTIPHTDELTMMMANSQMMA